MDELQETAETLIDLDEPEALLSTLRKAAVRKAAGIHGRGHTVDEAKRWLNLAHALETAEKTLTNEIEHDGHEGAGEDAPLLSEAKTE